MNLRLIVCGLLGHSRIQTMWFGYYDCARCGERMGDALGGTYPQAKTVVVVGHNCETCRENAKALTWKDRFLSPDPFAEEAE